MRAMYAVRNDTTKKRHGVNDYSIFIRLNEKRGGSLLDRESSAIKFSRLIFNAYRGCNL